MPQPEADYEIDFDPDEERILREAREDARLLAEEERMRKEREEASTDRQLAQIQAAAAKRDGAEITGTIADDGQTIEFLGEKFRVADKVGLMPLLKFASASDMDTDDPRALSAIYQMLKDCIHPGTPACGKCATCKAGDEEDCASYDPGDWKDFEQHAIDTKADADELLSVVTKVMEVLSGRPTPPRDGSSASRRTTRRASTGNSSGRRGRASKR